MAENRVTSMEQRRKQSRVHSVMRHSLLVQSRIPQHPTHPSQCEQPINTGQSNSLEALPLSFVSLFHSLLNPFPGR